MLTIRKDDRANGSRQDPNDCQIGDLYRPWYFYKYGPTGCPADVDQLCLVYGVEHVSLIPEEVPCTSFLKKPKTIDISEYLGIGTHPPGTQSLAESISERGQEVPIVCTQHYTGDSPVNILFSEGNPDLSQIRCFEGHHRLVSCRKLGIEVTADVYKLFHLDRPVNWKKHYYSIYDDSFWSDYQTEGSKQAWFSKEALSDAKTTAKYTHLSACFDFIKSEGITVTRGIDVGCAEGAYTFFAHRTLDCEMQGIDSEPGRIVRGLLVRAEKGNKAVNFKSGSWLDENYANFDFGMALSILHHMAPGEDKLFLENLLQNKKALIVEVRHRPAYAAGGIGSIKGINTQEYYEALFQSFNVSYTHVATLSDRLFYVLIQT